MKKLTEIEIQKIITKELENENYERYTSEYNFEYNFRKFKMMLQNAGWNIPAKGGQIKLKTYIINKKPAGIIARIKAISPKEAMRIFIEQNPKFDLSNITVKIKKDKRQKQWHKNRLTSLKKP